EIRIGDAPGFDPGKPFLIFLAVGLEYRIVRLLLCPLLEGSSLTAGLLSSGHRTLTVLRADPSGLREVAAAVLAAPHRNAPLHTTAQRIVDHVRNAGRVQNRRTPPRLHRLKAERNGAEAKQAGIPRTIVKIILSRLLLWVAPCAVHIQN